MLDQPHRRVVAIGASAGGIDAVCDLLACLPKTFPAPIVFALHASVTLTLPDIIAARTNLKVVLLKDGERLEPSRVHVCPGGKQTRLVAGNMVNVSDGRDGRRFAPSVDLLFASMGEIYGSGGIAVVLSGMLDDGAAGALSLYDYGATVLVQDPVEARYASMPESTIARDHPEAILTVAQIAEALVELIRT